MKCLTREEYKAIPEKQTKWVPLPHLGPDFGVYVRRISARERDQFESQTVALGEPGTGRRLENMRARFVALCASDENAVRIFEDEDAQMLGTKEGGGVTLDLIYDDARKFNRMLLNDSEEKELEKNFAPAQHDSSPCASPES